MPEARQLPAEGAVEQNVLRRRGDPLLGADHVGDLHQVIVDDVGEMVGGEAVGLHQHLVVDVVCSKVMSPRSSSRKVVEVVESPACGGTSMRTTNGLPAARLASTCAAVRSRCAPA